MKFETYKEIPQNLNQQCGFCNTPVNFVRISDAYTSGNNESCYPEKEDFSALYRCPNCGKVNLIILSKKGTINSGAYYYIAQYPKYSPIKMDNIPDDIEHDRYEAWKCYNNSCFNASAIMARASMQRAVRILSAEGRTLYDQIENLMTKGVITRQLTNFAHEVRITGNDLAHPDEITKVSQSEIEESLDFLDNFLNTVFVLPAIAERRKKDRESNKNV